MTTWQPLALGALAATLAGALAACAPTYDTVVEVPSPSAVGTAAGPAPSVESGGFTKEEKKRQRDEERHYNRRVAGWASLAIGSVGLAVALTTSYIMLHDQSVRSSDCPNKVCGSDGFSANTELQTLTVPNVGAWVVAAVGLGVGAFLVLSNPAPKKDSGSFAIGVTPNRSGMGLNLQRTF